MPYSDDGEILISGLQHLTFCERQWVLIHVERLWAENFLTAEGGNLHDKVHRIRRESRGDIKLVAGLRLASSKLGLYGVADMVEFHRDDSRGVVIPGEKDGTKKWLPYPVEYKRGRKRPDEADEVQMCAQAICLEEMLNCNITEGAIYHGEPKRRTCVNLTPHLRALVEAKCERARELVSGTKPIFSPGRQCKSCSMFEYCLPNNTFTEDRSLKYVKSLFLPKE